MKTTQAIDAARRISARLPRSDRWEPLQKIGMNHVGTPDECEVWRNRIYEVTVRRKVSGWPFGWSVPWAQIGICCNNGEARHDWREFQQIKNDVVGWEWEAIELYPSEIRLIDPSNYFILYAAPAIPIGKHIGRQIETPETCIAAQRGWK